jgi:cholesterol oxidase
VYTVNRAPLASDWAQRLPEGYDVVVVGSGYGGAIITARLAAAQWSNAKPSVCILERGKEWLPGQFPDTLANGARELRHALNPLGLYDFRFGTDIGVLMGSGLGGTSLINANVAFEPDGEVFDSPRWPQAIRDARDAGQLQTYFNRVRTTLFAEPHPDGLMLSKVQALKEGAEGVAGAEFALPPIAVNFRFEGGNHWGVAQRMCINCGDCVSGCNVGAKNTLDTNYLAIAKQGGTDIFTQVEVKRVEERASGGYLVHYLRRESAHGPAEQGTLIAKRTVVIAAGALGSTEIMLRSRQSGLGLPETVGTRFSGNADFFGLAYNSDLRTDTLGWGAYPDSDRARRIQPTPTQTLHPGPTIVSRIKYNSTGPLGDRVTVEDLSFPLMYVDAARSAFAWFIGRDTDPDDFIDNLKEIGRRVRDVGASDPELEKGALNYTLVYLVMGQDDAGGRIELDPLTQEARVRWPLVGDQDVFKKENNLIFEHAKVLGSTFIENPLWGFTPFRTLVTAHPLGGCPMGEDHTTGLVNHQGKVFNDQGSVYDGLYIADGSIVPTAIGVNPFLTISALAERIADHLVAELGGSPS